MNVMPWMFVVIGLMGILVLGWFVLLFKLFNRLKHHHPSVYDGMAKSPFQHSTQDTLNLLGFLLKREYQDLADDEFNRLAGFMRVYFMAVVGYFVVMFIALNVSFVLMRS